MANKPAPKKKQPVASTISVEKPEAPRTPGVKTLEIPNYSCSLLYQLLNVPLHGAQSRARARFARMISDRINYLEDERVKMIESRCKKDPKTGEPLRKGEGQNEQYNIDPAPLKEYQAEFDTLMKEKFVIDLLPSIKPDITLIRPLVLDSKVPLEIADGYIYETICNAFEAI